MKMRFKSLREKIGDMKYRHKLNLVLMLVGILPILIIGLFMLGSFSKLLIENEYEAMDVSLNQVCASLEKQADIIENQVNYIVFDYDLQEILETSQTPEYSSYEKYVKTVDLILNTPKFYHDGIERVTIYAETIEIPHDTTLAPLSQIEGEKWFQELEESEKAMWVWPGDNHEQVMIIRKFPGFYDKKSYLAMYCDISIFKEPLEYYEKEGGGMALVDDDSHMLYVQSDDSIETPKKYPGDIQKGYRYAEKQIENMPLSVSVFMREDMIYSGIGPMMRKMFLVVLVCLLLIVFISCEMSRLLVKRIEKLISSVNRIEMGSMELDIQDNSTDEIGHLIRSFRKMMGQIQNLIREVYESKIKQQDLEMKALQAQINPHFLYNTLSLINWKAIGAGEEDISKITLLLSDFYRTTLNKGESIITIEGEIKNIKSYIEIQLIMHDYDFEVEYQIDVGSMEYLMPKLILQPLVENALEHGLDLKEEGEKKLVLSCQETSEDIVLAVLDTGVGMDAMTTNSLVNTHMTGYGVHNVNDRLMLFYGENYKLHIVSYPGVGTKVEIHIPKKLEIQKNEEHE